MYRFFWSILILSAAAVCSASEWPQWRGPFVCGVSDETSLPDALNDQTLLWKTPLPGEGASTPVISNGRIFLTSTQPGSDETLAMCFDASDGRELWRKAVATKGKKAPRNNFASCSAVAYSGGAVFFFGEGTLVRLDDKGKQLWSRNLADDYESLSPVKFGYSSSPLLYDDRLYIPVLRQHDQDGPEAQKSFLLCVNAADGKTVFKHTRITSATGEAQDGYITPLLVTSKGKPQIVISGADYLTAHDPNSGAELWRYHYDLNYRYGRLISSPAVAGNILVFETPEGKKTVALDIAKLTDGQPGLLWKYEEKGPDVPSPVIYQGYTYIIDDSGKKLICIKTADGTVQWTGDLDRSDVYYASITAADGKLYVVNRKGTVSVVAADPKEFRILSRQAFDESPTDSTIAVADGRIYLRTAEHLYCFGAKK
jgi:outer membrane protein assembly factor BamB